jgi:sterol desaturase/sphingolipid hydroxylase (fatty acid hydroxylase superfamily)
MAFYGKILLFAMPAFLLLVLFEKWYGYLKNKDTVPNLDMISSLSSGITNVVKDVVGLSVTIISYEWMVKNLSLIEVKQTWLVFVIAFVALDFSGYWVHRIAHKVNFFWNNHIIHHSSEEFNLACALRQSISVFVKIFIVFLLPAALLGVPSNVIAFVAPLHLFAQFWYHTQHINKMGWLEKIIVTPSHHRVHHAMNKEYIDKNFGQIFIIWDKLFGTFQEELNTVPAVYGITVPVQTFNPIKINFQHIWQLIKDAWHTKSMKDKLVIWFKPTGWRPNDVASFFPIFKIEDVYNFSKYKPASSRFINFWSWIQLAFILAFTSFLFYNIAAIGMPNILLYAALIFLCVYSCTELMDGNKNAYLYEIGKNLFIIILLYHYQSWFGFYNPFLLVFVLLYVFTTTIVVSYYCLYTLQKTNPAS